MKKLIVCLVAIVTVLLFGGLTTVYAYPFIYVEGYVDPYVGTVIDDGTITTFGDVTYTFYVTDNGGTGASMNAMSLEFENDVFSSFGSVVSPLPADWTFDTLASSDSISLLGGESIACPTCTGTPIAVGDYLQFTVKEVVVYNEALVPGNGLWQEGQIWAQSWSVFDTIGLGDGGSTALVPEPGTLMLFGSGLVGLFYVRRSKTFNI